MKYRENPSSGKTVLLSLLDLEFVCLIMDIFFLFAREFETERK